MRYKMTICYDGNNFNGFQRQKNLKTVQGEIEKVLSKINNKEVTLVACGRTDKGVHAKTSVIHFDLDKKVKLYNLKKALNRALNNEIYVKDIIETDDKFHARYDCVLKEYRYFINIGEFDIFKRNYIYQYNKNLNVNKMKKSLKLLEGEHDFRSFCSDDKEKDNCVRTIFKTKVSITNNVIEIRVIGNGFLKHMIRNIVSYLILIGEGKKNIKYLEEVLNKKSREKSIKKVPGCGLYLWDVKYN